MDAEMGDLTLPSIVEKLLKDGNITQVLTMFKEHKTNEEIYNNAWDLVPIIAFYLNEEIRDNKNEMFKCCQTLIEMIAESSKPEEVLLQFIEEIETANDDTKFLALLKPSEKVLLRVPDKRIRSLAWCFNAIKTYLAKLKTPDDFSLTDEERLLLDSNSHVIRIINLYEDLLVFCDTFVQELENAKSGNISQRKEVIGKFLIELLGKPLVFLNMDMYKNTKPQARILAEKLVMKCTTIIKDPFVFLDMQGGDDSTDLVKPSDVSLAVFYYLILYEHICLETIPKVYNPTFVLHNSLKLITNLVTQECQFGVEKGIHLATALLKSINKLQLPYLLLDSEHHSKFCKIMSNVIIHNECQVTRKRALFILHNYLWAFEHQGRYAIVINLIRILGHTGLKGNLISQYKEMLTQELEENNRKSVCKYYKDHKLFDLLNEFTYLKHKEETDLVDESDQIVSTLNLLRYLIIADKNRCTGIDSYLTILEDSYFKYLKTGVELSKEHYRLKIKEIDEERATLKQNKSNCAVSVTVAGKNLAEMPTEKKVEILNLSLTTLDVIDSLLSRVTECLRARRTPT